MNPRDLHHLVAWRREQLGKSQQQHGAEAGTGQATISRIEQGRVDPRLGTLREVARALGMDLRIVPCEVLPAVDGLIRRVTESRGDAGEDRPLYRLEADDDGDA
ncbi:MAG: helix-turn-helix domain-containing protein [Gemmatimonadales bacterium]